MKFRVDPIFSMTILLGLQLRTVAEPDSAASSWQSQMKAAVAATRAGAHERGERLARAALGTLRSGPEDPEAEARLLTICGDAERGQGRYADARASYEAALRVASKKLGDDDEQVVSALTALASVDLSTGEFEAAESRALQILKILSKWDRARARSHESTIVVGVVLRKLGRYRQAKDVLGHALFFQRAKFGPSHFNTAVATAGVAYVDFELGYYEAAERGLENALAVVEKSLGKNHSFALLGRARLALVKSRLGRHEEAIRLIRSALEAVKSGAKVSPDDRARLETTAAEVLFPARQLDEAAAMCERALADWAKTESDRDPDQVRVLQVSGMIHAQRGERELARKAFETTWSRRVELLGPSHPDTSRAAVLLGMVEVLEGDHKRGVERLERAVSDLRARLSDRHPDVRESEAILLASRERARESAGNDDSD